MDFVFGGGGGVSTSASNGASAQGGLSHDNGPILYTEPNRTSAIDDIRSVVIYIFIVTIFLSFFLILPGIRTEKFPTFLCITTSLIVTSIILISLFGTSWHVANSEISAAYKAFSRDRIQGELSVNIGLQSVNITLRAHKYYILHATDGPIMMDNSAAASSRSPSLMSMFMSSSAASAAHPESPADQLASSGAAASFVGQPAEESPGSAAAAADELEVDEDAFGSATGDRRARSPDAAKKRSTSGGQNKTAAKRTRRQQHTDGEPTSAAKPKFTVKRVNVDINYNERFYWIEPNQMRHEYHGALERGLPYPILTVVEYLSQDDAGFNWSRQYRAAGYYSSILLWLSVCLCVLMFCLHCAAPKYGIYAMQVLGCLLLLTDLTYFTLVPKGEQKLVIPFEGQSLVFDFGWQFWLVLYGGCLSLGVGTCIVLYDKLYPNYIFTTVLDVDFDSQHRYYKTRKVLNGQAPRRAITDGSKIHFQQQKPALPPPFFKDSLSSKASSSSASLSSGSQSPVVAPAHLARSRASRLHQQQRRRSSDDDEEEENQTSEHSSSLRRTSTATSGASGDSGYQRPDRDENNFNQSDRQIRNSPLASALERQQNRTSYHNHRKPTSESPLNEVRSSSVVGIPSDETAVAHSDRQQQKSTLINKRRNHHHSKNLKHVDHSAQMIQQQGAVKKDPEPGVDVRL